MYPNPQDVLPLPPRPDIEQYRKRAKELVRAAASGDDAIHAWVARWIEALIELQPDVESRSVRHADRLAREIAGFAGARLARSDGALSQAQFVIARAHGFASWPALVRHIRELAVTTSGISTFERAADAIVGGDLRLLERLLAREPDLVRARSSRDHRATLLHYVAANGVENYRQKTPPGIVAIARLLLDAGAGVNEEADIYGGGATTLGLVVTSAHPRAAGVQNELADLLLARGARMDRDIVRSCLMNGCPEAALHMAAHGAPVGFEEAAGIGSVEVVARSFEPVRAASPDAAARALIMAAWYGRHEVSTYLLDHGVDVTTRHPDDGETALHIAAYQGDATLAELLIARGAPLDVADSTYGTPPLVWALHARLVDGRGPAGAYHAVVRTLVGAGAEVRRSWLDDERLRADEELYALLARGAGAA